MSKESKSLYEIATGINQYLSKFKHIIALLILVMLLTLSLMTYQNFDKQNQIIETCGFVDGDIKCVCTPGAWDTWQSEMDGVNINDIDLTPTPVDD